MVDFGTSDPSFSLSDTEDSRETETTFRWLRWYICVAPPVRTHHLIVNIPHSPCDRKGTLPLGEEFRAG